MLVPMNWLEEYVDVKVSPEKLADMISLSSIGVKEVGKEYLDLEVTYNRGDLLSIIGVAREVAVLTNHPLKWQPLTPPVLKNKGVSFENKSPLCNFYSIMRIKNVRNGQSPEWMRKRLELAGMRPLNILVDITNYVMLEYGQPLHAFDAKAVKDGSFIVRNAKNGETIVTLDGKKRVLDPEAVVIADSSNALAIGGVMGGQDSEVSDTTTDIFLEAALFDPMSIRKTSKILGLQSEASNRFVHSPSLYMLVQARARAAELYRELAGGEAAGLAEDSSAALKKKTVSIAVTSDEIVRLLGISVPAEEAENSLVNLGFEVKAVKEKNGYAFSVHAPYFRNDIEGSWDVIEEIARIYGYERLSGALPSGAVPPLSDTSSEWAGDTLLSSLKGSGYRECITYSFSNSIFIEPFSELSSAVHIANPISTETEYMRTTLLSNLLVTMKDNLIRENPLRLFEVGKVYNNHKKGLPVERKMVGIVYSSAQSDNPFFEIKGAVELLLSDIGIHDFVIEQTDLHSFLHPGRRGIFRSGKSVLGFIGELHPDVAAVFGVTQRVAVCELDFSILVSLCRRIRDYTPIPLYPPVIEDVSVTGNEKVLTQQIIDMIRAQSRLIAGVKLIDSYEDSRTFRISYQGVDSTLSAHDISDIREQIISVLEKDLKLTVRK